ncbi:putative leader peptide [Angustibacter sp. McL0619]
MRRQDAVAAPTAASCRHTERRHVDLLRVSSALCRD